MEESDAARDDVVDAIPIIPGGLLARADPFQSPLRATSGP
jgi:hypothetical protein